ncbi:uncharacterized protein DFL_000174 [Arthrobotrys flagrans]|uniref:Uncharacterized protein n=1 Tax=Arthrobotrys flagrans TaxID=97331 RepID=A0A437ACZ9_ARTFL|nr:hypothetical protein DFL_000174 [Arthrobotrys flagrans]
MVATEKNLYVTLNYKVRPTRGDVGALIEPRRCGSEISDDPTIGDVLKSVGGSDGVLSQNELGLQSVLVQTGSGDVYADEQNPGRKTIFRSESNPS